jgi:hypothetical protein
MTPDLLLQGQLLLGKGSPSPVALVQRVCWAAPEPVLMAPQYLLPGPAPAAAAACPAAVRLLLAPQHLLLLQLLEG